MTKEHSTEVLNSIISCDILHTIGVRSISVFTFLDHRICEVGRSAPVFGVLTFCYLFLEAPSSQVPFHDTNDTIWGLKAGISGRQESALTATALGQPGISYFEFFSTVQESACTGTSSMTRTTMSVSARKVQ